MAWQKDIKWKSDEYQTIEDFSIAETSVGYTAKGGIGHQLKELHIDYKVNLSSDWITRSFSVMITKPDGIKIFAGESDGLGNWRINNTTAPEFDGCIDIDILPTPFTNSLPLNRMVFVTGKPIEIAVVYIDALQGKIHRARQRYTKISETGYKFENVPNDFEAVITVDENKLVLTYPELFIRV